MVGRECEATFMRGESVPTPRRADASQRRDTRGRGISDFIRATSEAKAQRHGAILRPLVVVPAEKPEVETAEAENPVPSFDGAHDATNRRQRRPNPSSCWRCSTTADAMATRGERQRPRLAGRDYRELERVGNVRDLTT